MAEEQGVVTNAPEEDSDDVTQARVQIEETRSHMSDTIDQIKYRLSPATLMEEAKEAAVHKAQETVSDVVDAVKEKASGVVEAAGDVFHAATDKVSDVAHHVADAVTGAAHKATDAVSDAKQSVADHLAAPYKHHANTSSTNASASVSALGASIVETIKLNPVPAAIAGFALGWLVLSARRSQSVAGSSVVYSSNDQVSGTTYNLSDRASTAAQMITDRASDLKDRAADWAGDVRDSASELRDKAGDAVHNLGVQAKGQAGAGADAISTFIQEQPIAAGAIALLLGAAVAYSLPSTQRENQVMGTQRDRLVDQGKDAAQDVAHKVQTVATVALGKAQQSLGETASQAKQQIQQTVQDTKDAVVSEAQHQGLAPAVPA